MAWFVARTCRGQTLSDGPYKDWKPQGDQVLSLGLKYVLIIVHLSPNCINILILLLLNVTMHPLFSCSFLLALEDIHIPVIGQLMKWASAIHS